MLVKRNQGLNMKKFLIISNVILMIIISLISVNLTQWKKRYQLEKTISSYFTEKYYDKCDLFRQLSSLSEKQENDYNEVWEAGNKLSKDYKSLYDNQGELIDLAKRLLKSYNDKCKDYDELVGCSKLIYEEYEKLDKRYKMVCGHCLNK
jgi:hypothetical protein